LAEIPISDFLGVHYHATALGAQPGMAWIRRCGRQAEKGFRTMPAGGALGKTDQLALVLATGISIQVGLRRNRRRFASGDGTVGGELLGVTREILQRKPPGNLNFGSQETQ
jgi:hypothetical protein